MLLALPCGRDHMDVLQQSNNLRSGFITYLQLKQAAGIVNIHQPGSQMVRFESTYDIVCMDIQLIYAGCPCYTGLSIY
jgi:hypothetical protein